MFGVDAHCCFLPTAVSVNGNIVVCADHQLLENMVQKVASRVSLT